MSTPGTMVHRVRRHLDQRRRLGFALQVEGAELLRFAGHADEIGHCGPVTVELAVRWASLPRDADPLYRARRLDVVRRFAKAEKLVDSATEVPPPGLLGRSYRRLPPHIYTETEIVELLAAAGQLGPQGGLRPHTYTTLFGLLASTGLRISEALALTRDDVDLDTDELLVRATKVKKSRLVPVHDSTAVALRSYARHRDRHHPLPKSDAFFLTEKGTSQKYHRTLMTFLELRAELGWNRRRPPRMHDLRHTFAVRRMERWYEEGEDVGNRIVGLSTYLGHADIKSTYWYLSAAPDLLRASSQRFEALASGESKS